MAFVWGFHHTAIPRANLSSRCWLNPAVQTRFSPYSSQIRTRAAPSLGQEVSDCMSIIFHVHANAGREKDELSLWSLCVDTEEQYVAIKQSWRVIPNPCASLLLNRLFHLIIKTSVQHTASVPGGFICLINCQSCSCYRESSSVIKSISKAHTSLFTSPFLSFCSLIVFIPFIYNVLSLHFIISLSINLYERCYINKVWLIDTNHHIIVDLFPKHAVAIYTTFDFCRVNIDHQG